MIIKCLRKRCGHEGPVEEFPSAASCYHDLCCPKCGTTNLDTSALNQDWASRGQAYIYGDTNVLGNGRIGGRV